MECFGCNLIEDHAVTLNTGTVVCSSCPAWRLECEAKEVLRKPTLEERREYLAGVEKRRGLRAVEELKAVMTTEWGNRNVEPKAA